jgi:predicted dehydrogenase/nucleoside-diphosphate-sugar epimerase
MARHHAAALERIPLNVRLIAVADPDAEARKRVEALFPGIRTFARIEDALSAAAVDAVHICTPPATHDRLATTVLESGCHVYVEKPFAETEEAARKLLALAERQQLQICAGHQLLYEWPSRRASELLSALGSLSHLESYFSFRPASRSGRPLTAEEQLLDILPHPVYTLLRFLELARPPDKVELAALELGPGATVHALLRRGNLSGSLTVTLEGRPVESYLRLVGSNGTLHADYVRGTLLRLLGPGSSGVDKALNPYRLARQLLRQTTRRLARRLLDRQRSYPGLAQIFEAFYRRVLREDAPHPITQANILETTHVFETVARALRTHDGPTRRVQVSSTTPATGQVAVTGGTGFLGSQVVRELIGTGARVRVLARRIPSGWERVPGAEFLSADLANPLGRETLEGVSAVLHCAAATSGGWEEHQRNSLDSVEHLLRAAHEAGVRKIVHISSLAVLAEPNRGEALDEESTLHAAPKALGAYVWGKTESERRAASLARELGLELRTVRPGPIVAFGDFDPPGRLGRRVGNVFVAVGAPRDRLAIVQLDFAARCLAWIATHFEEAPETLNLLDPRPITKRELVDLLKARNPDLRVLWLPYLVLRPLSWVGKILQRVLRRGRPPVDLRRVFETRRYDRSRIASVASRIASPKAASEPTET